VRQKELQKDMADLRKFAFITDDVRSIDAEGIFDYEGYNPSSFVKELMKIEPNAKQLESDLCILAYFSVVRGNKPNKAMQKMSDKGKNRLSGLLTKYKVINTIPKHKNDVTIARIAGVVPFLVATYMKDMDRARVIGEIPDPKIKPLCTPSGAGLIPRNQEFDWLFNDWLKWAYSFNTIIKNGKESEKVPFFGSIVRRSDYLSDEERIDALGKLGIIKTSLNE